MPDKLRIRGALDKDAEKIQRLLSVYAEKRLLLPRSVEDILLHIGNFYVAESKGAFAGFIAARDFGGGLFELRSLAVLPDFEGRGIGSELVSEAVRMLKEKGKAKRIFALTYRPNIFIRLGFRKVSKDFFPEKIWSDCSICPKKDHCDEEAVLLEINEEYPSQAQ